MKKELRQFDIQDVVIKEHPYYHAGDRKIRYSVGIYDGYIWAWKNNFWSKPNIKVGQKNWINLYDKNGNFSFEFANWTEIPRNGTPNFINDSLVISAKRQLDHDNYVNEKY